MSDSALDLLSALVLEDGRRWGEAAVDVQWDDAKAVLDEASETPYHWLGRSRGYSKTGDLAGIAIAAMLAQAPDRARLFGVAADQAQGQLLLDAIHGFAVRTPELQGALTIQELKVMANRSGARLEILPADGASIWGRKPWFAIADEVAQWHESTRSTRVWEGLTTGLAKAQGSRLAVLTTAGDPAHFSYALRAQALDDPIWHVHEVYGAAPWLDSGRLAAEKRRLPESSYQRLFENIWTSGEDRLSSDEDLLACVDPEAAHDTPKSGTRYVVAVDLGVKFDRTAVVVAHAERIPGAEHPRIVVDRLRVWTPSRLRPVRLSEVEEWVREYAKRYARATIVFDPSQALSMMQSLKRDALIREFTFSASSVGKLATTLVQLVRARALALPPDEGLLDELRNVRLKETSLGVVRLDHDRNRHDDRVVALGIAASTLVDRGINTRPARARSLVLERGYRSPASYSQMDRLRPAPDGRGSLEAFGR